MSVLWWVLVVWLTLLGLFLLNVAVNEFRLWRRVRRYGELDFTQRKLG